jgi:hypothetical protein
MKLNLKILYQTIKAILNIKKYFPHVNFSRSEPGTKIKIRENYYYKGNLRIQSRTSVKSCMA